MLENRYTRWEYMLLDAASLLRLMPSLHGWFANLSSYFRTRFPLFTKRPSASPPPNSALNSGQGAAFEPLNNPGKCLIDNLDDDVLLSVFYLFPEETVEGLRAVLRLSHVCQRWYALCMRCPELWRRYALLPPREPRDKALGFNEEMLRRSGEAGLIAGWEDIAWTVGMTSSSRNFKLLASHAHRVRSLCIRLQYDDTQIIQAFKGRADPFPKLDTLSLSGSAYDPTPVVIHFLFGGDLSRLRHLVLRGVWLDMLKLKIGVNVETLSMHVERRARTDSGLDSSLPESFAECANSVARFAQLRSWKLDLFDLRDRRASLVYPENTLLSASVVTLTSLTTLDVKFSHMMDLEYLAHNLSLPACRELHVDVRCAKGAVEQRTVTEAFIRNHTDPLCQAYSELTVYNAGRSGFGFALSREARIYRVERRTNVSSTVLALKEADISLVFSQWGRAPCYPTEYRAFLEPLQPIARTVPVIIIFDGGGALEFDGFKMRIGDDEPTREMIQSAYWEGSLRYLVGYRELLERIMQCKTVMVESGGSRHRISTSTTCPELRFVSVPWKFYYLPPWGEDEDEDEDYIYVEPGDYSICEC